MEDIIIFSKRYLSYGTEFFRPSVRFTFKIDLDQVFDQNFLVTRFSKTALQLLCDKNWGGSALDWKGRDVELGLISGDINEADWYSKDLIPDIKRPEKQGYFQTIYVKENILLYNGLKQFRQRQRFYINLKTHKEFT